MNGLLNRKPTNQVGRNRGASTGAVIGGVVALVLIVGGFMYFGSDVWRTKMDSAARDFSEWTPENIAKDPVNYLNFAEAQAEKTMQKLKASEISIAQRRAKLASMKDENQAKVDTGERVLKELKDKYKSADETDSWPVQWQGADRDKDWIKKQIVSLHSQVQSKKNILTQVNAGLAKLDTQVQKIADARSQTQEQMAKIQTNREMLQVKAVTEELTEQLVNINGILETTTMAAETASSDSGPLSLDDLAAGSTPAVDDAEFDAIMSN